MAKQMEPGKATGQDGGESRRGGVGLAGDSGGSVVGFVASVAVVAVVSVARLVAKLWHGLTSDGTLAAFARQGADEIGQALKAFPDTIQVQETGSIWNPTPGEVQAKRSTGKHSGSYTSFSTQQRPWPSEIARDPKPKADHGRDRGHDAGQSM